MRTNIARLSIAALLIGGPLAAAGLARADALTNAINTINSASGTSDSSSSSSSSSSGSSSSTDCSSSNSSSSTSSSSTSSDCTTSTTTYRRVKDIQQAIRYKQKTTRENMQKKIEDAKKAKKEEFGLHYQAPTDSSTSSSTSSQ